MTDTVVSSGQTISGLVLSNGDMLTVLSGGAANSSTVSSGGVEINSGGTTLSSFVSNGGQLLVRGGVDSGTRFANRAVVGDDGAGAGQEQWV